MLNDLSRRLSRLLEKELLRQPSIKTNSKKFVGQLEELKCPRTTLLLTYDVIKIYPIVDITDSIKSLFGLGNITKKQCIFIKDPRVNNAQQLLYNWKEDLQTEY